MDAIHASDQTFRALVQQSQDIITVHDEQGQTLYESPSAARILGHPSGALLGRIPFASIHPKDVKRVRAEFQRLLQGEGLRNRSSSASATRMDIGSTWRPWAVTCSSMRFAASCSPRVM